MDITATGGSTVTQSTSGTAGVNKVTVSAAAAATTNTVSIARNTSGALHVIGIEPWLSTTKQVRIANAGVGGSAASDWAGNGSSSNFRSTVCIQGYAPDLTIISLGINDASTPASVSTWHSNMATIITAAQVSGDVIIVPPIPCLSTATANRVANIPLYQADVPTFGLPYFDIVTRFNSGDSMNTLGMMSDTVHPNALGYADLAQALVGIAAT
jgi:lysophospholipase L1-like esterase